MTAERYEQAFLAVSAVLLAGFLGALVFASRVMGVHVPSRAGELDPAKVATTPPFDRPGLHEITPGRYEAVIVARAWSYAPATIEVPRGSEVTFRVTSGDVVHGFMIEGTRVNLMLVPGQISSITQRFDEPGEHWVICHEYCGLAHHSMHGKVVVR